MNRLARLNHPCPTTIYRIVGDTDDVLAFQKFSVFALLSSLLVPKAAAIFSTTLRRERERKERHEQFVKNYCRKRPREFASKQAEGERALERLLELVEDRLFFRHQPRTIDTIPKKRPPFNPPHWTGDSTDGLVAVPLPASNVLTCEDATRLVRELGYDGHAAFASITRPLWMNAKPDRRKKTVVVILKEDADDEAGQVSYESTNIAQPIPYVAAPSRRTTQGFFSRDSVLKALASMRSSHKVRMAAFEVVFNHQSPTEIAGKYRLNLDALKGAAARVRGRIRMSIRKSQKPNVYAVPEPDASPLCPRVGG